MASPPKPWEQAAAAATTTAASAAQQQSSLQTIQQPVTTTTAAQYGSMTPYGTTTTTTSPYGMVSPYGSAMAAGAAGTYGSSMYSSPYGGAYGSSMAGYGSSMYGGGGYGSSMYGGGGYGSSMYGGGGYGSSMYGGGYGSSMYGGGYGSRYGGGMYGGGMPGMMGGPDMGMGWLGGLHQTVGSIGQMSELLGMNAEAMQFAFGAFALFLERIGSASHHVIAFLAGDPGEVPLDPQGRPMIPVDPRTGQPIIDPRTGQPMRPPTREEFRRERNRKLIRWLTGLLVVYMGYRVVRMWLSDGSRQQRGTAAILSDQAFNAAFPQHTGGMQVGFPTTTGVYNPSSLVATGSAPATIVVPTAPAGKVDPLEQAFGAARKRS